MKSYSEHLKSLLNANPTHICHRASALFPIFIDAHSSMKLIFLNYWLIKRNIDQLLCRLYVRDIKGNTVVKKCFSVEQRRVYEVNLDQLIPKRYPFGGSLEIEFASAHNLVFPFPAVVVHYEGEQYSTFVHSAQRTYNDSEDQQKHAQNDYIESGFNIYSDDNRYPFLTFVNGPTPIKNQKLLLAAYNQKQSVIGAQLSVSSEPYETTYIHLNQWAELKKHLDNKPGCLKVQLKSPSAFPRLIVGNRDTEKNTMSVTHSYYDLVKNKKESDFWKMEDPNWHAAAIALPLFPLKTHRCKVFFYPIYSPKAFWIDVEIYDSLGIHKHTHKNALKIEETSKYTHLDTSAFLKDLDEHSYYLMKLIARPIDSQSIPARIKVGYDVASSDQQLPCNICTNFYPANPRLQKKKKTFKWAPLPSMKYQGQVFCLNDAPIKNYTQKAHIQWTLYRKSDEQKLERSYTIEPYSHIRISKDPEINSFLKNESGFCTFESDNPYITTYSFSQHPSGMMGGDHGF